MVMKINKKNLTQAVILGLLLAVPVGVQATDYTDENMYNYTGTTVSTAGVFKLSKGTELFYNLNDDHYGELINPIKNDEKDDKKGNLTYEFQEGDSVSVKYKNNNKGGAAVAFTVNDYNVDLGLLSGIKSNIENGFSSYGIYAKAIDLTMDAKNIRTIESSSKGSWNVGVWLEGNQEKDEDGKVTREGGVDLTLGETHITASNTETEDGNSDGDPIRSYGIGVNDSGSKIKVGSNSTINASVKAQGLTNMVYILSDPGWKTYEGGYNGFIRAWGVSSQFVAESVDLGNATKITTNATYTGGRLYEGGYLIADTGFITKHNGESVGIYADGGEFKVGKGLQIHATGLAKNGSMLVRGINAQIYPFDDKGYSAPNMIIEGGTIEGAENTLIETVIEAVNTSYLGETSGVFVNAGKVTINNSAQITAKAEYQEKQKENTVRSLNVSTKDDVNGFDNLIANVYLGVTDGAFTNITAINNAQNGESTGIFANGNANVTVGNDSEILVKAGKGKHDSYGVFATSEKSNVNLGTTAIIVENNSTDTNAKTVGINAENSSTVTMAGGSILGKNADTGEFKAINAVNKAKVNVNNVDTDLDEKGNYVAIEGSLIASGEGSITMKATEAGSYLLGTITTDGGERGLGSKTNLTLGEGTSWQLTGDSNVTNLDLGNGGIVSMVENTSSNYGGKVHGNAHKLSIDNSLSGNGTFVMDLTYHDNNVKSYENETDSDFIYVHGGDGHEQTIAFEDTKTTNLGLMKADDKLYFARVKGDTARFGDGDDTTIDGKYNTVTAANKKGIYDYQFYVKSENNQKEPDYNDWFITCKTNENNPNGDSPFHSYNAGFALWRDDDTLLKRLGELRFTNDEGGVWVRVIGKKLEDNRALGFNTHAKTIQVGYDRKDVQEDGSGTWRKGFAIGYTEADTTFRSGKGENNYTDLTLYATNIRKHDHYWDLVARIGLINSEYDSAYGDHGDFDNWAGSISAEYGRKKKLNEDNWFIEPQAQLTYSYMWGDNYTTRNGARVEQGDADSLLGRAGFVISKEIESERKYPHRYYAKAFVMHEFLDGGEGRMFFGGDHRYESCDFKDTWYVVGVGANVDMGNQCTFYFDAEKNFKAHIKMPYRIEAGLRWEF